MRFANLPPLLPRDAPVWTLAAASVLTALPLDCLVSAWSENVGQCGVLWLATICCGLLLGRLVGEQLPGSATGQRYALGLLLCGAMLRCAAPWLRLRSCASAGLRLDCYALGVLAGSRREQQPLPPGRLALLEALWMPTELVLRRALNAALQPLAAL